MKKGGIRARGVTAITTRFSGKENGASDGDVLALYNCSSVGVVAAKGLVRCDL